MLWQEYDAQSGIRRVIIEFTNARENPLKCAIGWVGSYFEFADPSLQANLQYKIYDNKYDMSSFSTKYVHKKLKKLFSISSILQNDNWFDFIKKVKNYIGYTPVPWLINENTPRIHNVFGYLTNFSMGNYNYPFTYTNSLEILEL